MLASRGNRSRDITLASGNMEIMSNPVMSHCLGAERIDPSHVETGRRQQKAGIGKNFDIFCSERKQRNEAAFEVGFSHF